MNNFPDVFIYAVLFFILAICAVALLVTAKPRKDQ